MKDKGVGHLEIGKRIFIEIGTQLQIEIEGIALRFKSELVGMESDQYLIIKIPLVPREVPIGSIRHKLFPGIQIVVRYLHKGTVFGFRSKLIEAIFTPRRLLFLEYPEIIEHYDLRSDRRIDCIIPAKIIHKGKEVEGTILDINKKGCRYITKVVWDKKLLSVNIEEQITLRCQLPGVEGEQMISGKLKNIQKDKLGTSLGIQFQKMTPDIKEIIANYISTIREFF